jgi:hypothetical protein
MKLGRQARVLLGALLAVLATACGSSASTESGVSARDAGPEGGALGAPCDSPEACASGVCLLFTANAQGATGICSALCSGGGPCGSAGTCLPVPAVDGGACFAACSASSDCAGGLPCIYDAALDGGLCQPIPTSFCADIEVQGDCEACLGTSCCDQVTACAEDVACSKLESSCSGSTACANTLQASGNAAAQAIGACAASSCAAACQ